MAERAGHHANSIVDDQIARSIWTGEGQLVRQAGTRTEFGGLLL